MPGLKNGALPEIGKTIVTLAVGFADHTWEDAAITIGPEEIEKAMDDETFLIERLPPHFTQRTIVFAHVYHFEDVPA